MAPPPIGSHARNRVAPRKMPEVLSHDQQHSHYSKKRRKLQAELEPAAKTALENIVRVSPQIPPVTHSAPSPATSTAVEFSARGTERHRASLQADINRRSTPASRTPTDQSTDSEAEANPPASPPTASSPPTPQARSPRLPIRTTRRG